MNSLPAAAASDRSSVDVSTAVPCAQRLPVLASGVSWHKFGSSQKSKSRYVVKSEITGNYVMTSKLGVEILASLEGNQDINGLCGHLSEQLGVNVPAQQVRGFLKTCVANGLIDWDEVGDDSGVVSIDANTRRETLGIYSKVHNADALLDLILEYRRWWLNPLTKAIGLVLGVLGLLNFFMIPQGGGLIAPLKQMDMSYTDVFLIALPVVFVVELALHELGHALACRLMGARPKGFGVGLLFGIMPIVFTETTDSYTIPSRAKRAFVSFAGPMVNLMSFGLVMTLYWHVEGAGLPGKLLLAYSALPLSAFLVSMNPFYLRMDGYWILADWLERPNLRRDSFRYMRSLFGRGNKLKNAPPKNRKEELILAMYLFVAFAWTLTFLSYVTYESVRTIFLMMQTFFSQSIYF